MTRNVKRFLAVSLLSLTPSIALAGQNEFGDLDFLSQRDEYVSVRAAGSVEIPVLRGAPSQSLGPAYEDFYVVNLTGVALSPGYSLTGTPHLLPPNPLPAASTARFLLTAPTPPVTQTYYYTNNAAAPASGKTCLWQLVVSVTNGLCSAQVNWTAYNGAICITDGTQSGIDPNTCQTQIVTSIQ